MTRMLMTLAAAAGLVACGGKAAADPGGFAPPNGQPGGAMSLGQIGGPGTLLGAGDLPPGRGPSPYGWNPKLKSLFHWHKSGGNNCSNCGGYPGGGNPLQNPANWAAGGYGQGGPAYNPQGFPPGAYGPTGPAMQGTLVFPNHTFVRSPRDYFFGQMGLDPVIGPPR